MIVAYLLFLVIGANPVTDPPSVLKPFQTVDACLAAASRLNNGNGTLGDAGSISSGAAHYCVRVVYPV